MKRGGLAAFVVSMLAAFAAAQHSGSELVDRFKQDPFAVVADMPANASEKSGIKFVVYDPLTNATVAGASVVWCTLDKSRDEALRQALESRFFENRSHLLELAIACRFGRRYVSDRHGRVVVPATRQAVVVAVHRGRLAWQGCWGDGGVMNLGSCRWLRVRVADAQGKPAEGLLVHPSPRGAWTCHCDPIPTGKTGVALVPVQAKGRDPFRLVADVETRTPVEKKLEPAELETVREPLELRLPRTGTVLVTVVDKDGRPRNDVYDVLLSRKPQRLSWSEPERYELKTSRRPTALKKTGGVYRYVGAGTGELHVRVRLKGVLGQLRGRGKGPTRAGGVAEIRVVDTGLVEPRIQWPDGTPCRKKSVHIRVSPEVAAPPWFNRSFSGPHGLNLTTDDAGRARFIVPVQEFKHQEQGSLLIVRWTQEDAGSAPHLFARTTFDGQTPRIDTVKFAKAPIEAAGVVVDQAGAPMPRVSVQGIWSRGYTDSKGRFELRGVPEYEVVVLRAQRRGFLRYAEQMPFGKKNIRIVMTPAASVEGSFNGRCPSQGSHPTIELVDDTGRRPKGAFLRLGAPRPRIEGHFFPPGTYTFEIRLYNEVVHHIEGIELVAGQTCRDPRLQKVSWESYLRKVRIRVVDAEQRPLRSAHVTHWRPVQWSALGGETGQTDAKGEVTLWIPRQGAHLLVETSDVRWIRLESVQSDQTVVVTPKPELLVELDQEVELPASVRLEAWWQVDARTTCKTHPWNLPRYAFRRPDGFTPFTARSSLLRLPDDTKLRIEVRVRRMRDGKPGPKTEAVNILTTLADADQKTVRFQWSAAAKAELTEAIRRLRAR